MYPWLKLILSLCYYYYYYRYSVNKSVARARRSIGYCPQFDALSDSLTGREHLVLICKLRGIPLKGIKQTVDNAISRLELDAHADKPVYSYSGGNMRRLSTAIALIANPPVLLLVGVVLVD